MAQDHAVGAYSEAWAISASSCVERGRSRKTASVRLLPFQERLMDSPICLMLLIYRDDKLLSSVKCRTILPFLHPLHQQLDYSQG